MVCIASARARITVLTARLTQAMQSEQTAQVQSLLNQIAAKWNRCQELTNDILIYLRVLKLEQEIEDHEIREEIIQLLYDIAKYLEQATGLAGHGSSIPGLAPVVHASPSVKLPKGQLKTFKGVYAHYPE